MCFKYIKFNILNFMYTKNIGGCKIEPKWKYSGKNVFDPSLMLLVITSIQLIGYVCRFYTLDPSV